MSTSPIVVRECELAEIPALAPDMRWDGVIDALADKPDGATIAFSLPDDVRGHSWRGALRQRANRRGFDIKTRMLDRAVWLKKVALSRSRHYPARDSERNRQIIELRDAGLRLEEISVRFGVTRERVRQIHKHGGGFNRLPPSERAAAVNEFIAPYLAELADSAHCPLCGTLIFKRNVCSECQSVLSRLRRAAALLRCARRAPDKRFFAANAICLIRKYGIKPDDLRFA